MMQYMEDQILDTFGSDSMSSWFELDIPWPNVFGDKFSHVSNQSFGSKAQKMCCTSDVCHPTPQKLSFDQDGALLSGDEFEDHHLEQAIVEMANNGELDGFLKENTISLKEIQDDFSVFYGGSSDAAGAIAKPRARRNSIGTVDELIRCPFPGCNKIFDRPYNFKSHLKSHSNEKPFKCTNCPLSFARCHDLKRHARIHDMNRHESHKCDNCGRKFSRSDALNRHIRLNTCLN